LFKFFVIFIVLWQLLPQKFHQIFNDGALSFLRFLGSSVLGVISREGDAFWKKDSIGNAP
jgi:hypothetical protein